MLLKRFCLLLFFLFPAWTVYGQTTAIFSLDEFLQQLEVTNPQLQALAHQALADSLKIPQAGALPDPMISLNMLNLPLNNFVFDQEAMSGKQVALKQSFPFPGKLGLKETIARRAARVSTANYDEVKARLLREAKKAYFDLYFIDQAIITSRKNYRLIQEFVQIAEKKYSVGKGLQQDVLKAQVELSKMDEQLINFRQQREQLEARINTLRNHPVEEAVGMTTVPADTFSLPARNDLEQQSSSWRPLLEAWRQRVAQRQSQIALAKKSYLPDLSVFAAYTQRDVLQSGMGGVDFLSAGVSFNLPLYFWRKQDKLLQEKQAAGLQAQAALEQARNQVQAELDNALSALEKNRRLRDLYQNGIIPQATQALQSALIGYQTDKVDFLTLINNQKTLFNYELQDSKILSALNKDLAQLEFVTGVRIQ